MKKIIILFGMIIMSVNLSANKDTFNTQYLLGVYGFYQNNIYSASFKALPGTLSCCTEFNEGGGNNFAFGALFEKTVNEMLHFQMRLGYNQMNGLFSEKEIIGNVYDNSDFEKANVVDAIVNHSIDAKISAFEISPLLSTYPIEKIPFALNVGLLAGFMTSKNFEMMEKIESPEFLNFNNGNKTRNKFSGEIESFNSLFFAAYVSLSYDFRFIDKFVFSPEIGYSYSFTDFVKDIDWKTDAIRAGASLKYAFIKEKEKVITPPGIVKPVLNAFIQAFGLNKNGTESEIATFKVEEFLSRQLYPLLPYVFFNETVEEIPPRYIRINPAEKAGFDEKSIFFGVSAIDVYYHLLNIIGERMNERPASKITLTGCNSDIRREKGDLDLSRKRAENVRKYLTDIWGVNSDRIELKFRNLPENPTNGPSEEHLQENRRVEIYSDDWEIIKPVFIYDTLRVADPPTIKFKMSAKSDLEIVKWNIKVEQEDKLKKNVFIDSYGFTNPDPELIWDLSAVQNKKKIPLNDAPLKYSLIVTNSNDSTVKAKGELPVEQITIQKKKRLRIADKEIDDYRLIMFRFDTPDILKQHQHILDIVCENVKPDSKIIITGYTDKLGTVEYNKELSEKRANMLKDALKCKPGTIETIGKGKTNMYDNDVPEGRFYNRTVEVRVETPVKN